jgi:threonine/homoserine/homoserine lactone efflux protein
MNMKTLKNKAVMTALSVSTAVMMMPFASFASTDTTTTTTKASGAEWDGVTAPIIALLNSMMRPLLAIVGALGSLYCVFLGLKFAKAEEPQDREKAKSQLKNAIIGFVLIFVLILALNVAMGPLTDWVSSNSTTGGL